MSRLSEKQKRFADEYLVDLNASAAARRAGYQGRYGYELLKKEAIRAYIDDGISQRRERLALTQDEVVKELSIIAFASIADYMQVVDDGDGPRLMALPTEQIDPEKLRAVSQIRQGTRGVEVKLCDKMRALNLLGLHTGAFEVHEQGDGEDGGLMEALERSAEEVWDE